MPIDVNTGSRSLDVSAKTTAGRAPAATLETTEIRLQNQSLLYKGETGVAFFIVDFPTSASDACLGPWLNSLMRVHDLSL